MHAHRSRLAGIVLLALGCRTPPHTTTPAQPTTHTTPRPEPDAPAVTTQPVQPGSPFAAPAWLDAVAPRADTLVEPGFVLEHATYHYRVTRGDETLFTLDSLGVGHGAILAAVPVGDAVLVWVYQNPDFAALLWTPTGTQRLVTSSSGAFAVIGDTMLYARGPTVLERSLSTGAQRVRQRFPGASAVRSVGPVGRDVLALVELADPKRSRQDLYLVGRDAPLLKDVYLHAQLADRWYVHTNKLGNQSVGEGGSFGPPGETTPQTGCRSQLCIRVTRASAVIEVDANARARRLTPWFADPEQLTNDPQPPSRTHRLTTIRSHDGTTLRLREAPDLPWRTANDSATIVAPATPDAIEVAVVGERMVLLESTQLRVLGPGTSQKLQGLPATRGHLIADGEHVALVSDGSERVSISLAEPAPTHPPTHRFGPHTLAVIDRQHLALDGRDLPLRLPDNMRGDHSPLIDGAFAVPGAATALLAVGRQSHHGGHYVHDRVLALNLVDGSVLRVGPEGAWPLGEPTRQRFGTWRHLYTDASGRWLLMRSVNTIVLAPLDGGPATPVGTWSEGDSAPSSSADHERFAAIHRGRITLGDYTGPMKTLATPKLHEARITWAPSGHAFVVISHNGTHAVRDDGSVHTLACKGPSDDILEVLPDARAALLRRAGTLWVAAEDACRPVGAGPETVVVPRGQRLLERPSTPP